ncbi:hypothetical protein [Trinickia mobilis]|uniref:hypothetical protein n=1 Tax=Trinickia mobilis TaxID=2816356 RepID=UPI001A8E07FE|nr:hypothetical protein [Trinickia mobilis]
MTSSAKTGASLKRIGVVDRQAIEASLEVAALALLPDEYTQRDVFRVLMPKLYVMRKRGFGFRQITKLLEQAGLGLAIGTVRTYYYEFLVEMLEECDLYAKKAEKTLRSASTASGSASSEEAVMQAQAQVRSQIDGAAQTKASAAVGRLVATSTGEAGAWMAPAPSPAAVDQPPGSETPAARGYAKPTTRPSGATPKAPPANPTPRAASGARTTPPAALAARPVANGSVRCLTEPGPKEIEEPSGLPEEAYSDATLEHPAINGLQLNRAQRFYTARLRYVSAAGETAMEKGSEMVSRRSWSEPKAVATGRTSGDFVEMNSAILGKRPESN